MQPAITNQYPNKYESRVKLKDGSEVFIRPIMATDRHLIVDLFNKMSPQSIYSRFLSRLTVLSENMINQLINVDYHTNLALVAVVKENGKDAIIGVGRYGYEPDDCSIELAVAVRDDWQQAGLGKLMLIKVVSIAKEHGISKFTGMIDPQNDVIQKLLIKLGYKVKYSLESGFYKVAIFV